MRNECSCYAVCKVFLACSIPTYCTYLPTAPTYLLHLPTYCTYLPTAPTYLLHLPIYCTYLPTAPTYLLHLPTYLLHLPTYCTYLPTAPTYLLHLPTYLRHDSSSQDDPIVYAVTVDVNVNASEKVPNLSIVDEIGQFSDA